MFKFHTLNCTQRLTGFSIVDEVGIGKECVCECVCVGLGGVGGGGLPALLSCYQFT